MWEKSLCEDQNERKDQVITFYQADAKTVK